MSKDQSLPYESAPAKHAICYVSDMGYLLPTLVSAKEFRKYIPEKKAQIFIFGIGIDANIEININNYCAEAGISYQTLHPSYLVDVRHEYVNKTHVPIATIGRFFFADLLPNEIEQILYLDGDTIPLSDPSQLLFYDVPHGKFAAAEDVSYFRQYETGRFGEKTRKYFLGLGIDGGLGYFNAGLLRADVATWRTICEEAYSYFLNNTTRCLFHDQSALNAVAGRRRLRLSPAWNFATYYRYWGLERSVKPKIYHFAGGEKPWKGRVRPWKDMAPIYDNFVENSGGLGLKSDRYSERELVWLNRRALLRMCGLMIGFPERLRRYKVLMRKVLEDAEDLK